MKDSIEFDNEESNLKIFRHCVCEGCGGDGFYYEWPAGWVQTGASRFGNKYQKDGIAWWCQVCRKQHDKKEK